MVGFEIRGTLASALSLLLALVGASPLKAAGTLEELIAGGKKEGEIIFIAGAETFGGKKAFSELEVAFNKKYDLRARIHFTPGPSMPAMAGRLITELKAGRKSSTDFYIGSQSHIALLHQEKVLEKVNWPGIFPWVSKEMEVLPGETVLVNTSLQGIIYNSNLIPKVRAPKSYEDLVDPRLSPTWAGKMAIPPYTGWLVDLSLIWGEEKVKDFTRKLVSLSGGRLRYNEAEERVASGEFPIMASIGSAIEAMWQWQAKGAPLVGVPGSTPSLTHYVMLAVPKNSAHPNLAKLLVGFMVSREAQAILEKHDLRTSHLVEGTRMAKYLRDTRTKLQDSRELMAVYLKGEGEGLQLKEELTKMLRQ